MCKLIVLDRKTWNHIIVNELFNFQFLTILHWVFNPDLGWEKVEIICIPCIYIFGCLFWVIFFSHTDSTLLKRSAVPQSANFCISYKLRLPGILLICLSVLFLIILGAPTITGTVMVVLRCHIFHFLFPCFILFFNWYIICWHWPINYKAYFSFIALNPHIWSIAFYFLMQIN